MDRAERARSDSGVPFQPLEQGLDQRLSPVQLLLLLLEKLLLPLKRQLLRLDLLLGLLQHQAIDLGFIASHLKLGGQPGDIARTLLEFRAATD